MTVSQRSAASLISGLRWAAPLLIVLLPALLISGVAGAFGRAGAYERGFVSGSASAPASPEFRPLPGARAVFGELGGAVYRIEMPERWNGELVLWAHGFQGVDEGARVSNPPRPIRQQFISSGYAWAASSYSEGGYSPNAAVTDTIALKRLFVQQFSTPRRTYLFGQSMGGGVVVLSLEQFPNEYDGGLSVCGAVGGQEEIDDLLAWPLIAEFLVRGPVSGGSDKGIDGAILRNEVLPALGRVTAPTDAGVQFASIIREYTGGPRPFFQEGFRQQYNANFGFVLTDPDRQTLAARAATNVGARYRIAPRLGLTEEQINSGVRRLPADPGARSIAAPSTGRIRKPLLTIHNTGDLLVPMSQEVRYREKVAAAGASGLLVQRAIRAPGHCQFTDAEVTTAWNDLAGWVRNGVAPAGDDLSGSLVDVGRAFTLPLRAGDPGTE